MSLLGAAMRTPKMRKLLPQVIMMLVLASACAPAALPTPERPAAPPTTAKPAAPPTTKPAEQVAEKPAAKPTEKPADKTAAKTEASAKTESAAKQASPAYYEGRTVNLIIGTTPGSIFDARARIVARHLPRFVPGSPSVVPQNMGGGGGLGAMNHLYNVAPKDGMNMAMSTGGIYLRHIFGLEGIQHKLDDMIPLYAPEGDGTVVYAASKLGVKDPKDIAKVTQPIHYGVSTPEGNSVLLGIAGFKLLDVPVNPVGGYPGSAEIRLAVERGELDAGWDVATAYETNLKPLVEMGTVLPLFQSGLWRPSDNAIIQIPALAHIPTYEQVYRSVKGTAPSGPLWDAWLLPLISAGRGTIFFPPGVPEQALREMQAGFEAMCKDPQFVSEHEKLSIDPTCYLGDEVKRIVERASKGDPQAVEALRAVMPKRQ